MTTVQDVYDFMNDWAPFSTQEEWDNSGLLVGEKTQGVTGILTCLDLTREVVFQAEKKGFNLLVSHHPVIFKPLRTIDPNSPVALLIQKEMAALCAHTCLDIAPGGVNAVLAQTLGLAAVPSGTEPFLWLAELPEPMTPPELGAWVKTRLNAPVVRLSRAQGSIRRVALCSGSGSDFWPQAQALGAQALITGDGGHHDFLDASQAGFCLAAAGHYQTEVRAATRLKERLRRRFPELPVEEAGQDDPIVII